MHSSSLTLGRGVTVEVHAKQYTFLCQSFVEKTANCIVFVDTLTGFDIPIWK